MGDQSSHDASTGILTVFADSILILLVFSTPFIGFALIVHWLERMTQHRLAERFGWKSVLWTGWLGTPIHELSHAFMCWVFNHRIDEIALFEPDSQSGRLGYVRHSFRSGNWYQEMGNLFIGVAPLLGGSLALVALMWLFYPEPIQEAIALARGGDGNVFAESWIVLGSLLKSVGSAGNLVTTRFWVFIYLVLCIGSHMAPSPSDYRGAARGSYLVVGGLFVGALILSILGVSPSQLGHLMVATIGPLFAIFGLTIILCVLAAVVVHAVTAFFPQRYVVH